MKQKLKTILFSIGASASLALLFISALSIVHPKSVKADPLPVTHISGTLSSSQVWASGVYMVDNTVVVPDGVTLTINPSVIVKTYSYGTEIRVLPGGTLNVDGTSSNPVAFTSSTDDSLGGDSTNNGPTSGSAGDYDTAIDIEGGTVSMSNAVLRYAVFSIRDAQVSSCPEESATLAINSGSFEFSNSAINFHCSELANLKDVNMANVNYGIGIVGTSVQMTFRGSMNNVTHEAIRSCNWDEACSLDAAYTEWGSNGPAGKVCGKVTTSPWLSGGSTYNNSLYVPNCDGSTPTPQDKLNNSISGFQYRVSQHQIDCNNGMQDACQAISQAYACLTGALNVAGSTSPWPLPPAGTADQVNAFGGQVLDGASTYITSKELVTVSGFGFALANELTKVLNTFTAMSSAYSSCG